MALQHHPRVGSILICDYGTGLSRRDWSSASDPQFRQPRHEAIAKLPWQCYIYTEFPPAGYVPVDRPGPFGASAL